MELGIPVPASFVPMHFCLGRGQSVNPCALHVVPPRLAALLEITDKKVWQHCNLSNS